MAASTTALFIGGLTAAGLMVRGAEAPQPAPAATPSAQAVSPVVQAPKPAPPVPREDGEREEHEDD